MKWALRISFLLELSHPEDERRTPKKPGRADSEESTTPVKNVAQYAPVPMFNPWQSAMPMQGAPAGFAFMQGAMFAPAPMPVPAAGSVDRNAAAAALLSVSRGVGLPGTAAAAAPASSLAPSALALTPVRDADMQNLLRRFMEFGQQRHLL